MALIRERVEASQERSPIPVVLTGKLEVAPKLFVQTLPTFPISGERRGKYVQTGFGHMNQFDVRLAVTDGRISSEGELIRNLAPK